MWLDDDLVDRAAPEGWVHLRTAREVCLLLLIADVGEISLDNDLNGDTEFGRGLEVIDFLDTMLGVHDRLLLSSGTTVTIHSANAPARDRMIRAIRAMSIRHQLSVGRSISASGKPVFVFEGRLDPRKDRANAVRAEVFPISKEMSKRLRGRQEPPRT